MSFEYAETLLENEHLTCVLSQEEETWLGSRCGLCTRERKGRRLYGILFLNCSQKQQIALCYGLRLNVMNNSGALRFSVWATTALGTFIRSVLSLRTVVQGSWLIVASPGVWLFICSGGQGENCSFRGSLRGTELDVFWQRTEGMYTCLSQLPFVETL